MSSSDVSSVTKYFSTAAEGFSTTLGSTISAGATSVGLNSTSGLTNGNVFVGIIEPGATAQQVFTGTVDISGSQITNVVWVRGTNVGHAGGVTIVDYVSGASHNMMTAGILKQHTQGGLHSGITNTGGLTTDTLNATGNSTVGGTLGVTGATTLTGAVGGTGYDVKTLANSYKFSVYRNAAWTPATNTVGLVQFDTKEFDTGTNIDVATNKGRFTAPIAGYYHFDSTVTSAGVNNGAQIGIFLYKNGSSFKAGQFIDQVFSATGTRSPSVTYSGTVQLAAGDYVEIYYYGNAGTGSTGAILTHFSGFLVSAT